MKRAKRLDLKTVLVVAAVFAASAAATAVGNIAKATFIDTDSFGLLGDKTHFDIDGTVTLGNEIGNAVAAGVLLC